MPASNPNMQWKLLPRIFWVLLFSFTVFFGWASVCSAQSKQTGFQLQQFRPWGDPQGGFQYESANSLGQWQYTVGLFLNYAKDPLVLRSPDGSRAPNGGLIEHQIAADLYAGVGVLSWLDVYLSIPLTLYQIGSASNFGTIGIQGIDPSGFALSDLRLGLKAQILREKKHKVSLAIRAHVGFPTGNSDKFNGEESVTAGARLLLSKRFGRVQMALGLGYRMLDPNNPSTTLLNLKLNHEFVYSLGATIRILKRKLYALVEVDGSTNLVEPRVEGNPLNVRGGVRFHPLKDPSLAMHLGVGTALLPGYGSPQLRVIFGVMWAPRDKDTDGDGIIDRLDRCPKVKGPKENQGCPWPDTDGDGITDNLDKCPKVKGPKENKGCPWPDTDGDGITDNLDKCPKVKGPKENKGCPWPDTDGDGITDNLDKCPKVKGPKENNGCPWPDTDGDGLTDNIDKCPKVKGPKENKGCPDTDKDGDTVIDRLDQCPNVPGVKKATKKVRLGCPKKVLVVVTAKKIQILKKIYFRTASSRILRRSYPVLNQVLSVLKSNPKLRIRIEGHTDNRGGARYNKRLSQRRARSVRRYLVRKGIKSARLKAQGYGLTKPIDTNKTRRGRARNRRVEFVILK